MVFLFQQPFGYAFDESVPKTTPNDTKLLFGNNYYYFAFIMWLMYAPVISNTKIASTIFNSYSKL